jgi:riboflavin biosynthesis pyrimidine reductase
VLRLFPTAAPADDERPPLPGLPPAAASVATWADVPAVGRAWVRTVFIASLDGAVSGGDGLSGSLSTPADRSVFLAHRAGSDVILVGAGTARSEGYGAVLAKPAWQHVRQVAGQRPAPVLCLVTRSLRLDPGSAVFSGAERAVVLTSRAADPAAVAALTPVADVVQVGDQEVDLTEGLALLATRGLWRVTCEGGPGLFADLLAADLVDELALTLAPRLVGGDAGRIAAGHSPVHRAMRLHAAALDPSDATMLTRWRRLATPARV